MYQNCYVDVYERKAYIWDDRAGLLEIPYTRYAYVKDKNGDCTTMYGDKCTKVYSTKDAKPDTLFESDVNPTTRVLVDNYHTDDTPSQNHIIMTYDIEVDSTDGFPDPTLASNTITSIAAFDNRSNHYEVFILDTEGILTERTDGNKTVKPYDNEENLLMAFINYWAEVSPTIVTGWNTTYFDNPYLFNRIKSLLGDSNLNRLSPIGIVKFMQYKQSWQVAGVSLLDYLQLYKKFNYSEASSYSLNAIAQVELNRSKVEYEGKLDDLFKNDIEEFIRYNITDVELVVELDNKLQFIDLARGIAHAGRVVYEDIIHSSKYLEGAILTYLKNRNLVACNKPRNRDSMMKDYGTNSQEKFTGAYVKIPQGGLYEWVYDLDLTSLYPSIIMSLNISPETKIGKVEQWDPLAFVNGDKKSWVLDGNIVPHERLKSFLDEESVSIASNGVVYRMDVVGCIPDILSTWFDKRVEYKEMMKKYGKEGDDDLYRFYHKRQLVQKILLNSLYGVLGLPVFRFYDLDNAEAVTITGQTVIKNTAKVANMKYNKEIGTEGKDYNIYIDTDSVYFSSVPLLKHRHDTDNWVDDDWAKATDELASEMQKYINKFYDVFSRKMFNVFKHRFEIKKEYVARRALWISAKKRYAQWIIRDNGVPVNKLDVKGLDVVRSTFPTAFRNLMNKVLEGVIIKNLKKPSVDDIILDFKRKMRDIDPIDIARSSSVKNITKYKILSSDSDRIGVFKKGTPIHVKAAMAYNDLLRHFDCSFEYPPIKDGDKIKYVYLKRNPLELTQLAFTGEKDPPEIMEYIRQYIDINKIYDKELDNKLGSIYEALKWVKPTEQSSIASKFFSFK